MTRAIDIASAYAPHEVAGGYELGKLGMWVFLAGETMLFGGLMEVFGIIGMQRGGWSADSAQINWQLAACNTVVLLTSSMTAAFVQTAATEGDAVRTRLYLRTTAFLGALFLFIKGFEYAGDIRGGLLPKASLFWSFYYLMTGLHVLHLLAGIVIMLAFSLMVTSRASIGRLERKLKYACLYWYFVEMVWVFLFALVYLAPRVK